VKILIATKNPGKVREFREILSADGVEWDDLSAHPQLLSPEETGRTFRANACLKARYFATAAGAWAVADDSGLEVDAIGGNPGVHSARWAQINGFGKGDTDNNRLLLRQLDPIPDPQRTARFVCVLALADPHGRIILTARDTVEGMIIREERGTNGFGYDPLFYFPDRGRTTAELSSDEKHRISHRGKALRKLRQLMQTHCGT